MPCEALDSFTFPQGSVAQYGGVTPAKDYSPFGRLPSPAQPAAMSPQATAFSHPGNMYGLMVRASSFSEITQSEHAVRDTSSRDPDWDHRCLIVAVCNCLQHTWHGAETTQQAKHLSLPFLSCYSTLPWALMDKFQLHWLVCRIFVWHDL